MIDAELGAPLEAADATQRRVGPQASIKALVVGTPNAAFGDETSGEGAASHERTAGATRRFGNEGAETNYVENDDEPAGLFRSTVWRACLGMRTERAL
jgi:hypothetical protein